MTNSLATLGIPSMTLMVAVVATSRVGFTMLGVVIAFAIGALLSLRLSRKRLALVWLVVGVAALAVAVLLVSANWRLDGSPDYWPRDFPYADKLAIAIHEQLNSRLTMPFGNERTMAVIGVAAALFAGVAGWALTAPARDTRWSRAEILSVAKRERYYRLVLGAVIGLAVGLFVGFFIAAVAMSKSLILPFPVLGAFLGRRVAEPKWNDDASIHPKATRTI